MAALHFDIWDENAHAGVHIDGTDIRRLPVLYFRRRNDGPKEGLLEINRINLGDDLFWCITCPITWTAEQQFVSVRETVNGQLTEYISIDINNIQLVRFKEVRQEHEHSGYVYDGGTAAVPDIRYKDLDNGGIYQYTTVGLGRNLVASLHETLSRKYCLEDNGGDHPQLWKVVKYLGGFHVVAAATVENLILHVLEEGVEFQAAKLRQVRQEDVEEMGEMVLDQTRKEELMKLMKELVIDPLDPQYAQPLQVSK